MIINNILQNNNPDKLVAIKYYVQWQGGSDSGTVFNQRYTEINPKTPCNVAIVGDPITFTVEFKDITSDKICLTAYYGKGMQVDKTVFQAAGQAAKK